MPGVGEDVTRITAHDLAERLRGSESIVILDVRGREAWAGDSGIIPGAIWVPLEEVPRQSKSLPRDAQIVLYCS